MQTVKKKNHSRWYFPTHSHFNVRTSVKRAAGVHDISANSPEKEVHDEDKEKSAHYERSCDEPEDEDEEEDYEGQDWEKDDFSSALISQDKLHYV